MFKFSWNSTRVISILFWFFIFWSIDKLAFKTIRVRRTLVQTTNHFRRVYEKRQNACFWRQLVGAAKCRHVLKVKSVGLGVADSRFPEPITFSTLSEFLNHVNGLNIRTVNGRLKTDRSTVWIYILYFIIFFFSRFSITLHTRRDCACTIQQTRVRFRIIRVERKHKSRLAKVKRTQVMSKSPTAVVDRFRERTRPNRRSDTVPIKAVTHVDRSYSSRRPYGHFRSFIFIDIRVN